MTFEIKSEPQKVLRRRITVAIAVAAAAGVGPARQRPHFAVREGADGAVRLVGDVERAG